MQARNSRNRRNRARCYEQKGEAHPERHIRPGFRSAVLPLNEIAVLTRPNSIALQSRDDLPREVDLRADPMTVLRLANYKRGAASAERVEDQVARLGGHLDHAVEDLRG